MSENASLVPQPGHLYVVATPIGNLADLTERARAILGEVDLVACEDTRTTGAMLTRLGLHKELTSYHEHNETEAAERLADLLGTGKSIALVSDAGTPALSVVRKMSTTTRMTSRVVRLVRVRIRRKLRDLWAES